MRDRRDFMRGLILTGGEGASIFRPRYGPPAGPHVCAPIGEKEVRAMRRCGAVFVVAVLLGCGSGCHCFRPSTYGLASTPPPPYTTAPVYQQAAAPAAAPQAVVQPSYAVQPQIMQPTQIVQPAAYLQPTTVCQPVCTPCVCQ